MDFQALLAEERRRARLGATTAQSSEAKTGQEANQDRRGEQRGEDLSEEAAVLGTLELWDACVDGGAAKEESCRWQLEAPFGDGPPAGVSYAQAAFSAAQQRWLASACDLYEWISLRARRVQHHGGKPVAPNEDFEAEALPLWLSQLGELLSSAILNDEPSIPPDHVLVNEYQSDEGILAHTDGPFYHPCTMTISLLMPAVVRFRPRLRPEEIGKVPNAAVDMVLEPGSVLLFTGEAYSDWTHEVWGPDSAMLEDVSASMKALLEEGSVDGSRRRVSLTLRRVKKQPSAD